MRRPLIGITASRKRGWILSLLNRFAVWRAGGRARVLRPGDSYDAEALEGLVIGGGDDIDVELYSAELELTTRTDPARDAMELELLAIAARRQLPVLGICRGAQMINVARGGTLHTDIYTSFEQIPRMRTILPRKQVKLAPESLAARLLGVEETSINALHHQSIDRLGRDLTIVARDEHGIVQAIEDPGLPMVLGFQWHPELLVGHGRQQRLFRALVAAAKAGPLHQTEAAAAEAL
jgi:putative glutamine amidotransferase